MNNFNSENIFDSSEGNIQYFLQNKLRVNDKDRKEKKNILNLMYAVHKIYSIKSKFIDFMN